MIGSPPTKGRSNRRLPKAGSRDKASKRGRFLVFIVIGDWQPIAGFGPTFSMAAPVAASWGSPPCNSGRCFFSCIHQHAPTHPPSRERYDEAGGPPTSSAGPRQPRACAAGHWRSSANRVRGATTSGFVGRIMAGGSAFGHANPCQYHWPPRNPSSPFLHPTERGLG